MNILHIASLAPKANGISTVLFSLGPMQEKIGHNVKIISVRPNIINPDVNIEQIRYITDFKIVIQTFKPDIVVFHSVYVKEYIQFSNYLRNSHIPYCIELHGALSVENYKKNKPFKFIANILFYNKFIKFAKSIVYLNEGEYRNSIVKIINPNKTVIPNGCNPVSDFIVEKEMSDKINILYLGRIDPVQKALPTLMNAIEKLSQDGYSNILHFNFYGPGREANVEWLKQKLSNCVDIATYHGVVYGDKKDEAFKSSDIFILTSAYEGMPMSVLEALTHCLPCIITPNTNMDDIILENCAGWVTKLDSESIYNTILKATKEYRANHTILRNNSVSTSSKYLWERVAKLSIEQYYKLIVQ